MAYRPLYSGDLAALNVAAADQERNAIAARSGNQAFLQGLAQVAAARSGQASQERMGAADRENRMAMAQLADATARYSTDANAALGRQRNANDLLSSIQRNEQALAQLMVERDRIAALERQGIATNQLEKDKIAALIKQAELNRDAQVKIAEQQFGVPKVDARVTNELLAQNQDILAGNALAEATAQSLNAKRKGVLWDTSPEKMIRDLSAEELARVRIENGTFLPRTNALFQLPSMGRPMPAPQPVPAPAPQPATNAVPRIIPYNSVREGAGPTYPQPDPSFLELLYAR